MSGEPRSEGDMQDTREEWPLLETAQSGLIWVTGLAAGIAPLSLPAMLLVVLVTTLIADVRDGGRLGAAAGRLIGNRAVLVLLALAGYGVGHGLLVFRETASTWSIVQCVTLIVATWYVVLSINQLMETLSDERQLRFVRAVPIAAIVLAGLLAFEWVTGDFVLYTMLSIAPGIFDGFENAFGGSLDDGDVRAFFYNRNALAVVLLAPGVLASLRFWPDAKWRLLAGVIALGALAVCFRASSGTAWMVLGVMAVTFAVALVLRSRAIGLLQLVVAVLVVFAIPIAKAPQKLGLDASAVLSYSARARVAIWSDLADVAAQHPLLGVGVNATKHIVLPKREGLPQSVAAYYKRAYWHPHNGYLQIWLELGVVGAALALLFGYLAIGQIRTLPASMQPYAVSLAGGTLAALGPGFGLWQPWLIGAICFGWLALLVARPRYAAL